MTQSRIAYLLACVLAAPAAIATSSAEPATNPVASALAPCFMPNLQTNLAPERGDEFVRALASIELSGDQARTIGQLASGYCDEIAAGPPPAELRADEIAFHDGIKEALEPAQRAQLDDRVAQLRTEERVIGRLHEDGAA